MNKGTIFASLFLIIAVVYFAMQYSDSDKVVEQIPKAESEIKDQRENLTELMGKMLQRNKNMHSLEVELNDSRKEIGKLESDIEQSKNDLLIYKTNLTETKNKKQELESTIEILNTQLKAAKQELAKTNDETNNTDLVSKLKSTIDELNQKINESNKTLVEDPTSPELLFQQAAVIRDPASKQINDKAGNAVQDKQSAYRSLFEDIAGKNLEKTETRDVWIYSVFYEHPTAIRDSPAIHVVALTANKTYDGSEFFCILKYEDGAKETVPGKKKEMPDAFNDGVIHIMMDCPLTEDQKPSLVSFYNDVYRTPSPQFEVTYPSGRQNNITMCYSALFGWFDRANEVLQSLEYAFLMGAGHVYIYIMSVSPSVTQVLEHYSALGKVTVMRVPYIRPTVRSNYFGQTTAINDCHIRARYESKWVILYDTDEYVVPVYEDSWMAHIERLKKDEEAKGEKTDNIAAFTFSHAHYCHDTANASMAEVRDKDIGLTDDEIKFVRWTHVYLYEQQSRKPFLGCFSRCKSMWRPDMVVEPNAHQQKTLAPGTRRVCVDPALGQMRHFRRSLSRSYAEECEWTWESSIAQILRPYIQRLREAYKSINMRFKPKD